MMGKYRLFGDLLPFIGFEEFEISKEDLQEYYTDLDIDKSVVANLFTIEWLGRGVSFGGIKVPIQD